MFYYSRSESQSGSYNIKTLLRHFLSPTLIYSLGTGVALSQNAIQQAKLENFAEQMKAEWQANKSEAEDFAKQQGIPIRQVLADETIIEIIKIVNGVPRFYITENAGALAGSPRWIHHQD
jgi:hypothetical protein